MKLGRRVVKILHVDDERFVVRLRFSGGHDLDVRLGRLFDRPVGLCAEVLKGNIFAHCFVESGALAWPNGFELCPDALYRWAIEDRLSKSGRHVA